MMNDARKDWEIRLCCPYCGDVVALWDVSKAPNPEGLETVAREHIRIAHNGNVPSGHGSRADGGATHWGHLGRAQTG